MTIAILAEKPSVARDIAAVVGARRRENGALRGDEHVVTWAVGHLVTVAQPHEIDPAWRRWSFDQLPMIPPAWPLEVIDRTRDQYEVVARILGSDDVDEVWCATDAGREGELIFRYIYEKTGCRKPIRRLWISSLTPDAIRAGIAQLRDGRELEPLADAARGRSRADWLVGLNLSRAYSLAWNDQLSVGRVQTPTLAMLAERERAIRDFQPEDYLEVLADFGHPATREDGPRAAQQDRYVGVYEQPLDAAAPPTGDAAGGPSAPETASGAGASGAGALAERRQRARRLPADGQLAETVVQRAQTGTARISSLETRQQKLAPPPLYDLTELQRHANRLFGFSAQHTLDVAQQLYENAKLLSYPRTDSRHLSQSVAATLPAVVAAISSRYPGRVASGSGERRLGPRFVDDARVGDHHAIIPTPRDASGASLSRDQERIYDLVCRRLLSAWHADHLTSTTTVITEVTPPDDHAAPGAREVAPRDRYRSTGTVIDRDGWKVLDLYYENGPGGPDEAGTRAATGRERSGPASAGADSGLELEPSRPAARVAGPSPTASQAARRETATRSAFGQTLPNGMQVDAAVDVLRADALRKQTRPPPHFTEATLLTAMETAGRQLEDRELSAAMRQNGLGTPATRASIIETLLARGYAERRAKSLVATDKGLHLIDVVHPEVKSPVMTGRWEARLARIQQGVESLDDFIAGIETFVREAVARVAGSQTRGAASPPPGPPLPATPRRRPTPPEKLHELLAESFGFEHFRPYQEAVCRAVTQGDDVLLVMPTGAGKSLCYQLPGLARAGTTLVVSPLIALMEDQVAALQARGLRAERIHSGRGRGPSRAVCDRYLQGDLDFLFVAPERLSVPGFPELLARRELALVAVDEAHCISQWGHDFRPDYRMLRERLLELRPAPIIALTATATPTVQHDIVEQLGVGDARRFIHGFRRDNLEIEVVGLAPSARDEATAALLADADRRPAIVYAPTRKKADATALRLGRELPCAAYHAGMPTDRRERVQRDFLEGRLDVIVATIAFGMGIDKPNVRTVVHTALPASLEGYYQEIGRAGRDGAPSRAVLYHGYADRRTHEWFTERDYPEVAVLRRIHRALSAEPVAGGMLQERCRLDDDSFEKALEKLWIHGGAVVSQDDRVRRGHDAWEAPYLAQRRHREEQLARVARFAEQRSCRMLQLVRHFGDQEDDGSRCGMCDVCRPEGCVALSLEPPSDRERAQLHALLQALRTRAGIGVGRLHQETFGDQIDRPAFERLLAALVRAELASESAASFERDGEEIRYRCATATATGRRANEAALALVLLEPAASRSPGSPARSAGKRGPRRRSAEGTSPGTQGRKPSRKTAAGAAKGTKAQKRAATKAGGASGARPRSASKKKAAAKRRAVRSTPRLADPDEGASATAGPPSPHLVAALSDWRLEEARRRRTPAFRVLSNTTLLAIASARPRDEDELLAVAGVGPALARRHGRSILETVASEAPRRDEVADPDSTSESS